MRRAEQRLAYINRPGKVEPIASGETAPSETADIEAKYEETKRKMRRRKRSGTDVDSGQDSGDWTPYEPVRREGLV